MAVAPDSSFITTIIRNTCGFTRAFGYLPPHGKTLTNNQDYTFDGDLEVYLFKRNKRVRDHFKSDIANGYIQMTKVPHRPEISYYPVGSAYTINAGDLVYWDTVNSSARAAADFTWTTNLLTTQQNFKAAFLGVAQQGHTAGTAGIIAVDISASSLYTITVPGLNPPVMGATSTATTGGTLAAGTYFYKVTTLTAAGESTPSTEVSQATTGSTSTVTINWTAVTNATGYKIYRGTATGAENKLITTIGSGSTVTFIDTGGAGTTATLPSTNTALPASTPGGTYGPAQNGNTNAILSQAITPAQANASVARCPSNNVGVSSVSVRVQSSDWGANAAAQQ